MLNRFKPCFLVLACLWGNALYAQTTLATSQETLQAQSQSQQRAQQIIQQGQGFINNRQYQTAYELFLSYEPELSGEPQFDYWYGVAALRANKAIEAAAALERVIQAQPLHAGARLELATAYYKLDLLEKADTQIHFLSGLNAPPRAQQAIEQLKHLIVQRKENKARNKSFFSLTAEAGYDSNYLNYPDSFDLFANTFLQGIAVLEADSTAYHTLRGTAWKRWNQKNGSFMEGTLIGQARSNLTTAAKDFNTQVLHGSLVFGTVLNQTQEVRLGLDASNLWLDGTNYRYHSGLSLQWITQLQSNQQLLLTGAFRKYNFEANRNNYNAWSGDFEWRYSITPLIRTRIKANIEQASMLHQQTRQGGGSREYHISLHGDFLLNERQQILTTLGYDKERYNKQGFAVFNHGVDAIRSDKSLRAKAEWVYVPNIHWRYSFFAQYKDQTSTVDFFKLDQFLTQGSITYVF